jgi:glutamine amidotransferase-like uncharacterized protein
MNRVGTSLIQDVYVYAGHRVSNMWRGKTVEETVGPYLESVDRHFSMFQTIGQSKDRTWNVEYILGNQIIERLSQASLSKTLFVIPAGESSNLDNAFSGEEIAILRRSISEGMKLYATCGSAYWLARQRIWNHKSLDTDNPTYKKGLVNIFPGAAMGPLCPYPGQSFGTAFFHESIRVETNLSSLNLLSSGGGSFFLQDDEVGVKSIARYSREELQRLGKGPEWENAVVSCEYGEGKAILSMVLPEESKEVSAEIFRTTFPDRQDNWERLQSSLSPLEQRMDFISEVLEHFETEVQARL